MKIYIHSATTPYDYNQNQTQVGSPLKTLKGSRIARSRYGVGKEIGGSLYLHRQYADEVIPQDILEPAKQILSETYPDFEYNCIRWDYKTNKISFQESPDFDTAREPVVGDYVTVDPNTGKVQTGHSDYIWHHKWLFIKNDYFGFDVKDSWDWSRTWLNVLKEPASGVLSKWIDQLQKVGLQ